MATLHPPVSISTIAGKYQPGGGKSPGRPDRPHAGMTPESPSNDAAGANALVGISGVAVANNLIHKQGANTNCGRTVTESLPKEGNPERRTRVFELEPRRLVRSVSVQAKKHSSHDSDGGHNLLASTQEIGLRQGVGAHHVPFADSESQGSTQGPSAISPYIPTHNGLPDFPRVNPRTVKSKGWIRRLSMPVLLSFDGSKRPGSPINHDHPSRAWKSSLALPETKTRHRKASLDTLGGELNGRH